MADEIRKLGRRALSIRADVSFKADVEDMVKKTVAELGNIDILINNAAIVVREPFVEVKEDTWDKIMDINLKGCYLCSQTVGRLMVEQKKGNIINVSSESGLTAHPLYAAYCVSKAGVIMLTRVLAREFGSNNIRVNAIAPWATMTKRSEPRLTDPEYIKAELPKSPLGRFGETNDVIGAALFLASDAASWITGHTLVVDGGYLA